jgi:hypothetical protein
MPNARLTALLNSGLVKPYSGPATCAECNTYNEVLDGLRKPFPAKYESAKGKFCGLHAARMTEDRETVWNDKTESYVAKATAKKSTAKRTPRKACHGSSGHCKKNGTETRTLPKVNNHVWHLCPPHAAEFDTKHPEAVKA